jgi:hypothetical protein
MTRPRHADSWSRELSAWRAGLLSPQREARLQRHLADCLICAAEDRWEQAISRALAGDFSLRAPADFNHRLWQRLETLPAPKPFRWHWLPATLGALGVAAAAAALVLTTYRVLQTPPEPPAVSVVEVPQPVASFPTPAADVQLQVKHQPEPTPRPRIATPEPEESEEPPVLALGPTPAPTRAVMAAQTPGSTQAGRTRPPGRSVVSQEPLPQRKAAGDSGRQAASYTTLAVSQARLLNNTLHLNRNERARLEFTLDEPGKYRVAIFSREGKLVATLLDQELAVGPQVVEWDGAMAAGQKAASGIYVMILSGPGGEQRFKLAVIK